MAPWNGHLRRLSLNAGLLLTISVMAAVSVPLQAQSGGQNQSQAPAQDIPDAPSTVQPPEAKPAPPAEPPDAGKSAKPLPFPGEPTRQPDAQQSSQQSESQQTDSDKPAPPPMPPVETITPGSRPRNQINPKDDLYKISVSTNFVQIPVLVKDSDGRRVDGLLASDFTVLENGQKQTLTFFTSDPFALSVAVLIDLGVHDVTVQKINQTYSALVGAFSPYDEVGLYTYSTTVSQVTDFTAASQKLTAQLNQLKTVRGANNGPPVLGGPLASGPTVNGLPVGGPPVQPVNTPPRTAHVLNDAILRAALDLSKRDRTRRKVIFVISDGEELGSTASFRDVLRLLLAQGIQVKAVAVGSSAIPIYNKLERIHLKGQGFDNLLPKYTVATGGGQPFTESSAAAMEQAYQEITSEARNQYTLGYSPKATTGSSAYRTVEVVVYKKGLKISAKDGYYPMPAAR